MSYEFQKGAYYRMPTHFGPSLGPRQGMAGRRYLCDTTPDGTIVTAVFEAKAHELERFLPPRFSLREPYQISLEFSYLSNIEWLAGRGYNTFGVSIPVTYEGQKDKVYGDLLLVLWENMADPIISGREDLGFAKVYCELPSPDFKKNQITCSASWDNCKFAALTISGLTDIPPKDLFVPPVSDGLLHYKYIPKTGVPGEADMEYAVLTPSAWPNVKLESARIGSDANCFFRQSSWSELPTLVHIVNALSEVSVGNCIDATLLKCHGGKDLSDQRILR